MTRYATLFERLSQQNEGALVPFTMVGDPSADLCLAVIDALVAGGADALELGIPFSDPVADGPVIQDAHIRAFDSGVDVQAAFECLAKIRGRHPDIPMGLLVYANLPFSLGIDQFYARCAAVGVDSVLIPDVPIRESVPFSQAAERAGIAPVYIAPPSAPAKTLEEISSQAKGYVYAVSRVGVTGADQEAQTNNLPEMVKALKAGSSTPVLLGFGISKPKHVRAALQAGVNGTITGSAVVQIITDHTQSWGTSSPDAGAIEALQNQLESFIRSMKEATRP